MSGVNFEYSFHLFTALVGYLLVSFALLGKLEFSLLASLGNTHVFSLLVWRIRIQFVHLAGKFSCFIRLVGQIIIP